MNDGGDPNLENICRNIDRLVTVEMRIS
ncbi:MAG: hypothetical protein K0S42_3379, partial [Microvirga sp.]|nr:hypothetical protein [Microvirga sp.]